MKKVIMGLAAAALLAPSAFAQGISVGPGGVRMDSGSGRYERRSEFREDSDRRDRRGFGRRGGCRTIIVKKRDEFGRRVTKRVERC
jgi:hypothetical protein